MAKKVEFTRLSVQTWQPGDTVAAYRNGRVVRIPVFGPADLPELAKVATTGRYGDLVGHPSLGSAAAKNSSDFATAPQGVKAETAWKWGDHASAGYALNSAVTSGLSQKVDKQSGYGLSQQNFTAAEKQKLDGIEAGANKFALPAGANGQVLKHNGTTWTAAAEVNTTYGLMSEAEAQAATATTARTLSAQRLRFAIEQHAPAPPVATTQTDGLMAAADKEALNGLLAQEPNWSTAYRWGNHADAGYVKTNTTYSTGTLAQLSVGSDITGRLQTAKNLNDWLIAKGYVTTDTIYTADIGLNLNGGAFSVKYGAAAGTAAQGNDSRLSNSREWTAATVSQAEAEAGTADTRRAWTAQRIRQGINAWWQVVSSGFGRNLVQSSTAAAARNTLELRAAALREVGESSGNVMEVGAFGLGPYASPAVNNINGNINSGFYSIGGSNGVWGSDHVIPLWTSYINVVRNSAGHGNALWWSGEELWFGRRLSNSANQSPPRKVWHNNNFNPADYLLRSGGQLSGKLLTTPSTTAQASLTIPTGIAPSAPVHGDVWASSSNLMVRLGATTRTIAHTASWSQVSQAEAEAGSATTNRLWTSLRVRQSVQAYAHSKKEVADLISAAANGARVWQTATTTLIKNQYHSISFTNSRQIRLPANPVENDFIEIVSTAGSMKGSTMLRNGKTIMGVAEDMEIDAQIVHLRLDYVAGSWRIVS